MDLDWAYDRPISAQRTVVDHDAGVSISRTIEPQVELWDTDFAKLKPVFEIKTITFNDGTSMNGSP
jgi:hypothetical protein